MGRKCCCESYCLINKGEAMFYRDIDRLSNRQKIKEIIFGENKYADYVIAEATGINISKIKQLRNREKLINDLTFEESENLIDYWNYLYHRRYKEYIVAEKEQLFFGRDGNFSITKEEYRLLGIAIASRKSPLRVNVLYFEKHTVIGSVQTGWCVGEFDGEKHRFRIDLDPGSINGRTSMYIGENVGWVSVNVSYAQRIIGHRGFKRWVMKWIREETGIKAEEAEWWRVKKLEKEGKPILPELKSFSEFKEAKKRQVQKAKNYVGKQVQDDKYGQGVVVGITREKQFEDFSRGICNNPYVIHWTVKYDSIHWKIEYNRQELLSRMADGLIKSIDQDKE